MELGFPLDVILFFTSALAGLFIYTIYFRPKESLKAYKVVSKRLKDSSLYKSLGFTAEFHAIEDKFATFDEVSRAVRNAGLESSNLIIGIDFTASNEWQGRKSFSGRSLHHVFNNAKKLNPYQRVVQIISKTLEPFDEDNLIPAFGFGDLSTKDHSVFSFNVDGSPCKGLDDVLRQYREVVRRVTLSGPTSFAPLINKAVEIVKQDQSFNILVIVADGQVVEEHDQSTREAIVEASNFPLAILVVGVGDGPWDRMKEYDELLPQRRFDNFQFVEFEEVIRNAKYPDTAFALHALMEIPDQYKAIIELELMQSKSKED